MERNLRTLQIGFYENELCRNILPFWLDRCEDIENGGYVNCFSNDGSKLVSRNKYIWSEGRFLWMFSKMSRMQHPFTAAQRKRFLELAKSGRDFLVQHGFAEGKPLRCVFLTDEKGNPLLVPGYDRYDISTGADGFAIIGLCEYAIAANDEETYRIVKELYASTMQREESFQFGAYPYPISDRYVQHGMYMGWVLRSFCMSQAAERFEPDYAVETKKRLKEAMDILMTHFVDENYVLREVLYRDFTKAPGVFGNHSNPGHILEEMWFIQQGAEMLHDNSYTEKCAKVAKKALENGWDPVYGGLYHFCSVTGGEPIAAKGDPLEEPTYHQLMNGWGDKLWWAHSEALYSTLLFAELTGDRELMDWYWKIFEYTFRVYPNPNREIGEWIQILTREGRPQEKVTGLPVKDPFHITRNLICILELLYAQTHENV